MYFQKLSFHLILANFFIFIYLVNFTYILNLIDLVLEGSVHGLFFLDQENDKYGYETENGHVSDRVRNVLGDDGGYRSEGPAYEVDDAVSLATHKDREEVLVDVVAKVLNCADLQTEDHEDDWQQIEDLLFGAGLDDGDGHTTKDKHEESQQLQNIGQTSLLR